MSMMTMMMMIQTGNRWSVARKKPYTILQVTLLLQIQIVLQCT